MSARRKAREASLTEGGSSRKYARGGAREVGRGAGRSSRGGMRSRAADRARRDDFLGTFVHLSCTLVVKLHLVNYIFSFIVPSCYLSLCVSCVLVRLRVHASTLFSCFAI